MQTTRVLAGAATAAMLVGGMSLATAPVATGLTSAPSSTASTGPVTAPAARARVAKVPVTVTVSTDARRVLVRVDWHDGLDARPGRDRFTIRLMAGTRELAQRTRWETRPDVETLTLRLTKDEAAALRKARRSGDAVVAVTQQSDLRTDSDRLFERNHVTVVRVSGSGTRSYRDSGDATQSCSHLTHGPGADLSNCDLAGADLTNAHLAGADLSGTDLTGTDLTGADLSDTDLSDADVSDTDLAGADLAGADLTNTATNPVVAVGNVVYLGGSDPSTAASTIGNYMLHGTGSSRDGTPFFDTVILFAANIDADSSFDSKVTPYDPNIAVLTTGNLKGFPSPATIAGLHSKGVTVQLAFLPNWKGTGWSCPGTTVEASKRLADAMVAMMAQHGLDGISIDDEYANCPEPSSDGTGQLDPQVMVNTAQAIKANPAFAGKVLSKGLWTDRGAFTPGSPANLAPLLDQAYSENYFAGVEWLAPYEAAGMAKTALWVGLDPAATARRHGPRRRRSRP